MSIEHVTLLTMVPSPLTDFSGAQVLITGGLGFIGSHVARQLVDFGAHVTVIGNLVPEADLVYDPAEQTSHLDSMKDPRNDLAINTDAQLSIIEACHERNPGTRVVFANNRQLICEIEPMATYELVPFPEDRKKIDIGDYYADTTLIQKELGWEPSVSLTEGITETLNFYRENSSQYWDK